MVISSRTPEGMPNHCPVCGSAIKVDPSEPSADAPCPNCGHLLWFTWDDVDGADVIRPIGRILQSEDLNTFIDKWPEKRGGRLVLDLGDVQYIASSALGKLIVLKKKVVGTRGKLSIVNLHPDLLEIFRITHLDQVFDLGP